MAHVISSNERRLGAELRSDLRAPRLEVLLREGAKPTTPSWEVFSKRLDRCYRHVAFYVGQRVDDRERLRQIVSEVLAGSLDLLLTPRDEQEELRRLEASADRLLFAPSGDPPECWDTGVAARSRRALHRTETRPGAISISSRLRIHRWGSASIFTIALLLASLFAWTAKGPDAWITTKIGISRLTAIDVDATDRRNVAKHLENVRGALQPKTDHQQDLGSPLR